MLPPLRGRAAAILARFPRRKPHRPPGVDRIYHYHVRKTGGTSLNAAFWNLAGLTFEDFRDSREIWKDGFVFVRHSNRRIEDGRYFFAHTHTAYHQLSLPPNTFTITILRDPLERVLSHYRYLLWLFESPAARDAEPFMESIERELEWLGSGFGDFISNMPASELQRQLFFFSPDYDIKEAFSNIIQCSAVLFTKRLDQDLQDLAGRLDLPLVPLRRRVTQRQTSPDEEEIEQARLLLRPEIDLFDQVWDAAVRNTTRSARSGGGSGS